MENLQISTGADPRIGLKNQKCGGKYLKKRFHWYKRNTHNMKYSDLHDYQLTSIDHIIDNTHCALFLEMGLGKTVSTLTAINRLMFEELDIDSALVVAPKRVAESVWDAEIDKWEHLSHLKVAKINRSKRD